MLENKIKILVPSLFLAGLVMLAGCGVGFDFPMAPVTGTVLCEKKPVEGAMVYFEPLKSGESAMVGPQSFSFSDKDGKFKLSVNGTIDGAVVGKHRVRVGGSNLKCNCTTDSETDLIQVEIKASGTNDFVLELKPKVKNEPVVPDPSNNADNDGDDIK